MNRPDVQAPPPFSPGAPQFAPHGSNRDRGNRSCHSQLGKPVNPQSGGVFQAQSWLFEGPLGGFSGGPGPMGPEQLIKTATGQRRRRLRDEARSRRQWRHLCCDRAGCWPSAGAPGVSGAAQWLAFRSPPLPSLGLSSFVGGVITRYGSGAEQSEDDVGCRYDQQSGFEYSDTGSGPARRLRRQYPRDRAAACVLQRLGADERGARGWQYALIILSPAGLPQRGRRPSDHARAPSLSGR